jgi:hypothetical protein
VQDASPRHRFSTEYRILGPRRRLWTFVVEVVKFWNSDIAGESSFLEDISKSF